MSRIYAESVAEADPVEVGAWRMAAGRLASEDLPEIATEALNERPGTPTPRVHHPRVVDHLFRPGRIPEANLQHVYPGVAENQADHVVVLVDIDAIHPQRHTLHAMHRIVINKAARDRSGHSYVILADEVDLPCDVS